jgi:hypothetical protein
MLDRADAVVITVGLIGRSKGRGIGGFPHRLITRDAA